MAAEGQIVIRSSAKACCCCEQHCGEDVPWYEHDNETLLPIGWFCWACGDVVFKQYPYLTKYTARAKARDERFRKQVVRMARIRLGADAKYFYPQEVLASWTAGWRLEEDVRLSSSQEFKEHYGELPEGFIGANCVPFRTARGEEVSY